MIRTDNINDPNLVSQARKGHYQISSTIQEHNILIYCILNAEVNIIFLNWNKQHLESGIIKWECRLLNENFHLVLMFPSFGSMQICIGSNIEPYGLHFGIRLASTCLQSRHLQTVERQTRTMVFWTSFPLLPPHFDDWRCHLDQCHRSVSSDHQTW